MLNVDLESFSHIRRRRDARFSHEIAVIMPGEYFVSNNPMIVYTVLGSCVSVCIRDTALQIGGMNHFMLPAPKGENGHDSWGESTRYGSFAMEVLMNEIIKRGGKKERFEIKLFGGAKIYAGMTDVGKNNGSWILNYLQHEGLKPVISDIGDIFPRKVFYFTETGRVLLKKIERVKNNTIQERERRYRESLVNTKKEDDITLF